MEAENFHEVEVAEMLREIVDNYSPVLSTNDKEVAELRDCLFAFIRKARAEGFEVVSTGSFNR